MKKMIMARSKSSMANGDERRCVFPLTGLQIGDLQSYRSDLSLFLALESKKLYILVDNRPWLRDRSSRPAQVWQLMVTKSRLSPFANSKVRREKRDEGKANSSANSAVGPKKFARWFRLVDAVTLSRKRVLLPVKKLRDSSSLLSDELLRTLYGFIVFEVEWDNVRGINYLNELQTDTSMALETKLMRRWEFDSIAQAASRISSWFPGKPSDKPGKPSEKLLLKEYLNSALGEVFYDAEDVLENTSDDDSDEDGDDDSESDDNENVSNKDFSRENNALIGLVSKLRKLSRRDKDENDVQQTPPPSTGPYKRRDVNVTSPSRPRVEVGMDSEDISDTCSIDCDKAFEASQYRDVLILLRFNDHDLPFKLRKVIMSDLRLLTLLEAGLPSWVLFLQSYPGFCHLYRPWMCPLARALYVLISVVTVLIGFYDLYKNVPVLKATVSRLFGPLFDWIETWEMITRIKYLGTMLFLHNFQKAVKWFLTVSSTTRSFLSVLTQPLAEPLLEVLDIVLPVWNVSVEIIEGFFSGVWVIIESSCSLVGNLVEIFLFPIWFVVSVAWNIVTTVLYPIFWVVWEVLYAPIRLVLAFANLIAFVFTSIHEMVGNIWEFISGIVRLASASEATVTAATYEVSIWRSLWNDLFSQVFRAIRSILNGFVAFFAACNRHRLSIYNHMLELVRRLFGQSQRSRRDDYRLSRQRRETRNMSRKLHIN